MADADGWQSSRVFVHRRLEAFPLLKQFQAMRTHLHIGFSLRVDGPASLCRGMHYTNYSGIYQHKRRQSPGCAEKQRTALKAVLCFNQSGRKRSRYRRGLSGHRGAATGTKFRAGRHRRLAVLAGLRHHRLAAVLAELRAGGVWRAAFRAWYALRLCAAALLWVLLLAAERARHHLAVAHA